MKSDPLMKRRFEELQKRMHRNQAIVAIARHLLELVWYVLTRRQPYRRFSQERIAYKYLTWAWHVKEEARRRAYRPAICALLPDEDWDWPRLDADCAGSKTSTQVGQRGGSSGIVPRTQADRVT